MCSSRLMNKEIILNNCYVSVCSVGNHIFTALCLESTVECRGCRNGKGVMKLGLLVPGTLVAGG